MYARSIPQRYDFPSESEIKLLKLKIQLSLGNPRHMLMYMSTNNEIIMIRQYKHNEQEINSFAKSTDFNIYNCTCFQLPYNQVRAHNSSTRTS